jgi:hypothetical protein
MGCGIRALTIHSEFEVGDGLLIDVESLFETVEKVLVLLLVSGVGKSSVVFFGTLHGFRVN